MAGLFRHGNSGNKNGNMHGQGENANPLGSSGYGYSGQTNFVSPYGGMNYGNAGGFSDGTSFGGEINKPGGAYPRKTEIHFAIVLFLASIIGAVIFFLIGEVIYRGLIENVNSIVFMGVYFAVLGFILALCLFIGARISGMETSVKGLLVIIGCVLFVLVFGMFFEFLYELGFADTQPVKADYIFTIDNSGSMDQNDPDQKRVAAIKQLLEGKDEDTKFAVYTFSEEIRCIRQMGTISDGIGNFEIMPNGGTPIVGVLAQIMDDMESGVLPYDEGSRVILLTDGYATDNDFFGFRVNKVLKKYNKKKVSISTIGLGEVDEQFLSNISEKTGGVSLIINNVDELGDVMESVVQTAGMDRNLLSPRARTNLDWLYALMRIVFTAILVISFIGIKVAITDDCANASMIIISSVIGSVVGAVILEFGLSLVLTGRLARLLLVLLISLLLTTVERVVVTGGRYGTLGKL